MEIYYFFGKPVMLETETNLIMPYLDCRLDYGGNCSRILCKKITAVCTM